MLLIITVLLISYLIGSVPTAYIFGRLLKGIDIRKAGSGNVGATNALRVLGKAPALAVLLIDIAKGLLAVIALPNVPGIAEGGFDMELLRIALGVSCITGHNWTIFLGFKGGKGMATSLGVLLAFGIVMPPMRLILLVVLISWLAVFVFTRIVSLASIVSALALPVCMILTQQKLSLVVFSLLLAGFVVLRHRGNIGRLFKGAEPRLKIK